jgi:aryl-phospho-beta-D-glucosidase BglC (GH1 family)
MKQGGKLSIQGVTITTMFYFHTYIISSYFLTNPKNNVLNLVRTNRFCNNPHQERSKSVDEKDK